MSIARIELRAVMVLLMARWAVLRRFVGRACLGGDSRLLS